MKNTMIKFLRPIKRRIQALRGYDCFFKPDLHLDAERIGSNYGGWMVPLGALKKDDVVYAAGVGTDISFDLGLINSYGVDIHAFDPTPKVHKWLKSRHLPEAFKFHPWGFSNHDGTVSFHVPKNEEHISHSMVESQVTAAASINVAVKRIVTTMKGLGHNHIDLLKMDIEGAEYAVIEDMLTCGIRPTYLLIEFHHRFTSIQARKTKSAIALLRRSGYQLYSVSTTGEEYGFRLQKT